LEGIGRFDERVGGDGVMERRKGVEGRRWRWRWGVWVKAGREWDEVDETRK